MIPDVIPEPAFAPSPAQQQLPFYANSPAPTTPPAPVSRASGGASAMRLKIRRTASRSSFSRIRTAITLSASDSLSSHRAPSKSLISTDVALELQLPAEPAHRASATALPHIKHQLFREPAEPSSIASAYSSIRRAISLGSCSEVPHAPVPPTSVSPSKSARRGAPPEVPRYAIGPPRSPVTSATPCLRPGSGRSSARHRIHA